MYCQLKLGTATLSHVTMVTYHHQYLDHCLSLSCPGPEQQQGLEDDQSASNGHMANGAKSSNDLQRARYFVFEQVRSQTE